jgi:hypothetical protein
MKTWTMLGIALLFAVGCKSREDKVNDCYTQCSQRDKEFESKCPDMMLDKEACAAKVAELDKTCRETCDQGIK